MKKRIDARDVIERGDRIVFQDEIAERLHEAVRKKYGGIKGAINFYIRQAVIEKLEREDGGK